jgi:hypothetical protein
MERDLNKLYLAEGIRLSGSILEQWTSNSNSEFGTITYYHVKVLYEAPGGGMYVKNFKVTQYEQSLENIQLIILPQYPASAILYSTIDPLAQWMPFEVVKWFTIGTVERFTIDPADQFEKMFFLFMWIFLSNFAIVSFCRENLLLNDWAVALIIVCEVYISFVIGYFMSFSMIHDAVQNIMFDATPYDESPYDDDESSLEVQQPCPSMPRITYEEIFPHGSYTFCSILQSIVIDLLKSCVRMILFVLGIFLAGLWCICPIIDERTKRRISEQYIVNGTIVEGKVVHRFALGWKARVQYTVTDTSTSNILRYEKTIPGAHLIAGRQVQIPDDLRLYILHPDLPCSARFADEIELHDKTYEFNKWVEMAFYIVYLALQQSVCVWLLFYQFPTAAWSLSVISTCAIVLGVQLFMLWGFATLRSYLMRKDVVHNAMQLFDIKSDISLKCSAVDNTLTLGDSTTTSEDSFDSESPSPCRRFYQGEVMYDKVRPID